MSLIKQFIPNEKDNFSFSGNNASFNSTFNYLTSNGTGGIKYNKDIKIENEVSFSIWLKMGSSKGMHLMDMRTSDTWGYQPIYIDDSKIQYHRHDGNSGISFEFSNSFETGKWYHICIRAKNEAGKIECWLNGQKLNKTFTDNPLPIQGEFPLYIGSRFNAGASYFLDGQIKDVRIYNHWVSDYEIKELSKGLCCHYSFDDASNLLINAEKYTKNSPLVRQGSLKDNWELSDMQCELIPNQTYIFQFKCDGNYSEKHYDSKSTGVDPGSRLYAVWFYLGKDSIPTPGGADKTFYIPQSDVEDGPNGCRYYIYKNTSGYKYLKVRTNAYSNGTDQITINFWDFKLTLGDKLTPWTPYNSVYKINDNSGFNNNSTKVNNVVGVTSSKIGPGAGLFNGADSYVALPTSCKIDPPFTYNIWAYMDNWNEVGGKTIVSCTQSGGYGLFGDSTYLIFESYNSNVKNYLQIKKLKSELSSGWHMFTYSFNDDGSTEAYIDGQSIGSITNNNFMYSEQTNTIFLGGEAGADTETPNPLANCFNGKIDDFRLYSSVLSSEDIKDLYNCRCAIDNKHNMKASSYKEENSTFNVNSNGIVGCTNFVENEYLYMEDGAKFLKIFEHDIRNYPEFFKNNDEAKKFVGKNRFSRLIDLSDSSFRSIDENKYEFILRYPDASYTAPVTFSGTENKEYTIGNIYDITNKLSKGQYTVDDLPYIECDGITFKTYLRLNLFQSLLNYSATATLYINTPRGTIESTTATIIEGTGGVRPFKDLNDAYLTFVISENNEFYIEIGGSKDSVNGILRDGDGNNITLKFIKHANGDLFLQNGIRGNHLVGSNSNFSYYNRWKQSSDPNTSPSTNDTCDPIYLSMTKQWDGKGLGLSETDGSTYLECQSSNSSLWFGAIGQTNSSWNGGKFPAPDENAYQHVQLWVRVDNTNYNKSGNSISKSIVNQYMKFDNSTPAIDTGVTLTSNSKVSVSFKCNSAMNRGCIVFGQGALGELNNTFEMYVWKLGILQQIQLNIGKENITYGISDFTANTVYNIDVYGDGNYVINGTSGKLNNHVCGTASLANTCLIGAIHRRQNENDPYTEYKTITDGVVTQINKFEIWEKDGNGNYSILKYRYYSPQCICTADNFIED